MEGKEVKKRDEAQVVGMWLNNEWDFERHVRHVQWNMLAVRNRLANMFKNREGLFPLDVAKDLIVNCGHQHMLYAGCIWLNSKGTDLSRINRIYYDLLKLLHPPAPLVARRFSCEYTTVDLFEGYVKKINLRDFDRWQRIAESNMLNQRRQEKIDEWVQERDRLDVLERRHFDDRLTAEMAAASRRQWTRAHGAFWWDWFYDAWDCSCRMWQSWEGRADDARA